MLKGAVLGLLGAALAAGSTAAWAQSDPREQRAPRPEGGLGLPLAGFVEAGVTVFDLTTDAGDLGEFTNSETAGTLRGGVVFFDRAALEVDYSLFSTGDDIVLASSEGGGPLTVVRGEADSLTSLFARGDVPLFERFSVHGRVGFARLDVEDADSVLDDDNGVAFGVGARWGITGGAGLRLDYTRIELDDSSADAGTLVFSYAF